MPWPPRIARQFQIIPHFASEMDLHGPYNKLLNYLFSPESEYTVIPRAHFKITARDRKGDGSYMHGQTVEGGTKGGGAPSEESQEQENRADHSEPPQLGFMLFEVQYENLPVLVVLLTSPVVINSPLAREMADAQMRGQLLELAELCPLNTLRGISAFGTQLCFFTVDTSATKPEIYPAAIIRESLNGLEDVAPRDRWALDLLDKEGGARVREMVENIKTECVNETGGGDVDAHMADN